MKSGDAAAAPVGRGSGCHCSSSRPCRSDLRPPLQNELPLSAPAHLQANLDRTASSQNAYAEALALRTSECDCAWRKDVNPTRQITVRPSGWDLTQYNWAASKRSKKGHGHWKIQEEDVDTHRTTGTWGEDSWLHAEQQEPCRRQPCDLAPQASASRATR